MVAAPRCLTDILLIDNDPQASVEVRRKLLQAGYRVCEAKDGLSGLKAVHEQKPAAVILDDLIKKISSEDFCRVLKKDESTASIPVIIVSANGRPNARIAGLEWGADDVLTKPFDPRELVLRLGALLRRYRQAAEEKDLVEVGPFKFFRSNFEIRLKNQRLDLTGKEFKLLAILIENCGNIVERDTLLRYVWGGTNDGRGSPSDRTLDTHVRRLRAKLGDHADWIKTVRNRGYLLRAE